MDGVNNRGAFKAPLSLDPTGIQMLFPKGSVCLSPLSKGKFLQLPPSQHPQIHYVLSVKSQLPHLWASLAWCAGWAPDPGHHHSCSGHCDGLSVGICPSLPGTAAIPDKALYELLAQAVT